MSKGLFGTLVCVLMTHPDRPDGTCCGEIRAENQQEWAEHVAQKFMDAWGEQLAQQWREIEARR